MLGIDLVLTTGQFRLGIQFDQFFDSILYRHSDHLANILKKG
jgi:hypothetical protein